MGEALVGFIVVAVLCGLGLWALSQFPIDGTVYKFIRIAVIVVLAVMLLNLLLVVILHKNLAAVFQ